MAQGQVFINFRGRDGRYGFVSILKDELRDNNISVFTDEDAVRGEPLENLFRHIRKSRIALVIFSKHYADSKWCLEELVEIKKCIEVEKLDAIPIFYKVKAAHVRKQTGRFGERFLKLENELLGDQENQKKKAKKSANSRIKRWRRSLVCVAGKMGLTYEKKSPEKDFVKKIVEEVKRAFAKISSEEGQNRCAPSQPANPIVFHFSRPLEALNLERSKLEGRTLLAGLLSSAQQTNSFRFLPGEENVNPVQHLNLSIHSSFLKIPPNLQVLDANNPPDSLETAANLLALLMLTEQIHRALIFSNWDKMDQVLKNKIVYYARRKSQQMADELRRYNGGVDLMKPVSRSCLPVCEAPSWFKMIDHKRPQEYRYENGPHNASFSGYGSQINPLPANSIYETDVVTHPIVTARSIKNTLNGDDREERDDTTCFSVVCYLFKRCLCIHDERQMLRTGHQRTRQR